MMAVNIEAPHSLLPIGGIQIGTTSAIKSRRRDDLTVLTLDQNSTVSAVFTQNKFPAAPVLLCRQHLKGGQNIRALAINAGIANAGTLPDGLEDAKECCVLLSKHLGCQPYQILPFSTGVIMERLPMKRYADGLKHCVHNLHENHWLAAAKAIMTTDTVVKGLSQSVGQFTITGIAKGSGMISPNMATMLAYVATDAIIPANTLSRWLREINADTFNAITVDGDTSTNDSFVLIATGKKAISSAQEKKALKKGIAEVCAYLADAIVRDGEGAKKFITIVVQGGKRRQDCEQVARSVANSPLVKTALAASDANIGRLLMAIGNADAQFRRQDVAFHINTIPVFQANQLSPNYCEKEVTTALQGDEINITITLGKSNHCFTLKTCDLTHAYIDINASYRS